MICGVIAFLNLLSSPVHRNIDIYIAELNGGSCLIANVSFLTTDNGNPANNIITIYQHFSFCFNQISVQYSTLV